MLIVINDTKIAAAPTLLARLPGPEDRSCLPLPLLDVLLRHLAGDLGDLALARLGKLPLALRGSR